VHWNFFFTLAAVSILTSVVRIHPKHCGLVGLLILAGTDFSSLLRWTSHR
jgi:glucosaminylphosphatidylinositol acyltransferase